MIKLVYNKGISDSENFSKNLAAQGINVLGISTLETEKEAETHIFVDDKTDEKTKSIIDDEMRNDASKPLPEASASIEEELIIDEARPL